MVCLRWPISLLPLLVAGMTGETVAAADAALDFGRDIRPILAENCFRCHGPDAKQRQGGLRLDVREEIGRAHV